MRDLKADLEMCNKATPGPWKSVSDTFEPTVYTKELDGCRGWCIARMFGLYTKHTKANAKFVAQAREGWPHAIERAIKSEALVKELIRDIGEAFAYAEHGAQEYYARERLKKTIQKAKEVLGDGEVR